MKKARTVLAVILTGMLLFGCSGKSGGTSTFTPTQSSIYVARDGKVSSALVEQYDKDYYDQTELKTAIETAVAEYNTGLGRTAVTLGSCTLGSGKAIALFEYENSSDVGPFVSEMEDTANQTERLEITTVGSGLSGVSTANMLWRKAGNGSDVSAKSVLKKSDRQLVIVDGTVTIQTEGKIQYYSGNVTLVDGFTATVNGGTAYLVLK